MGDVGWELHGSSPTTCAGKADHGFGVCVSLVLICLLKIVYELFYCIKNLKSRLYAANLFRACLFEVRVFVRSCAQVVLRKIK